VKVHLVGIAGSGMSVLAKLLFALGYEVSGCDADNKHKLDELKELGIDVFLGHSESHLNNCTMIVYSSAIKQDHIERHMASALGLPQLRRAEMLANILKNRFYIGVAGTHGKTTVTNMIGWILRQAGFGPTVLAGAELQYESQQKLPDLQGPAVVELDESDRSMELFSPNIAVVTNIELDHVDMFADVESAVESFSIYASNVQADGSIVAFGDSDNVRKAVRESGKDILYYGFSPDNNFRIASERKDSNKGFSFKLDALGKTFDITLPNPGRHNRLNATAAIAACYCFGIDIQASAEHLASYPGAKRRLELITRLKGVPVYLDYAHHPSEISATLQSLEELGLLKIMTIFQPHRYSRYQALFDGFVRSLSQPYRVIVLPIFGAGESGDPTDARKLANALPNATYVEDSLELGKMIRQSISKLDAIICMGAGDIADIIKDTLGDG